MKSAATVWLLSLVVLFTAHAKENPLLQEFDTPFQVPPFNRIQVEHFVPAFEQAIKDHNQEIEAIVENTQPPTFENTIAALDYSGEKLNQIELVFYNLRSADSNPQIQEIAKEISPKLSAHYDSILLNADLFKRVKTVYNKKDKFDLNREQETVLEKIYKDFVRGGADLSETDKDTLRDINQQMSLATIQFGDNVLAETNDFQLILEESDLDGLPEWLRSSAAEAAKDAGHSGKYVFTLHKPSWIPFLQYSERRDLREKLYKAVMMRGDNGNENDNKGIIRNIVNLRVQKAHLLGYDSHAHYVLDRNMAGQPERVYSLLNKLWGAALPVAKQEAADMQAMIDEQGDDFKLASWDWWYYAEKVRQQKYALSEEELKPYFKLTAMRDGAFDLANRLFGLEIRPLTSLPVYHDDVETFEVLDRDGTRLGILYMDFYTRASKRGGAWCTSFREQMKVDGERILPVVSIVTNFPKPSGDTPSLLSYDNVETLFHEFGHGLHNLLSQCTYPRVSGTSVPRDFVELPSQIMENWPAEPSVIRKYAWHYKTGEPMPDELIAKLDKSKHFNQGFATVEYLAASFLDMDYHTLEKQQELDVNGFEDQSMKSLGLIDEIIPRYRSTYFMHIFSGGYSSGYYSYIWAEVLDADAYQAFKENGLFDPETAESFRKYILETGGSDDAMVLYKRFRGHEPTIKPLLERRGLE
ncbi:MAG: M3 family metallopeptidase [candidate division KSB1 bacterium]|nr:M3 family metallopeptidase [candidate division KSB1 bacterium]